MNLYGSLESAQLFIFVVFLILNIFHDFKLLDGLLGRHGVLTLSVNRQHHQAAAIIITSLGLIDNRLRQYDAAEVRNNVGIYRHFNVARVRLEDVDKLDAHGLYIKT